MDISCLCNRNQNFLWNTDNRAIGGYLDRIAINAKCFASKIKTKISVLHFGGQ